MQLEEAPTGLDLNVDRPWIPAPSNPNRPSFTTNQNAKPAMIETRLRRREERRSASCWAGIRLPPEAATAGHLAELGDCAADPMPAARRAVEVLIHHLARHPEFARNFSLRQVVEEVAFHYPALRLGEGCSHEHTRPGSTPS
jgi:hypothetical protein